MSVKTLNDYLGTENDVKLRNNFELKKVKSAGRALKTAGSKLPENRRIELEEVLKTYYSVQEVNRILYTTMYM